MSGLRAFAQAVFPHVDLLLTPVLAIPVPTIAETTGKTGKAYLDMVVAITRNTKVINYLGLPAIGVPCGFTSNGLPTSFQLIGRPLQEAALLRASVDALAAVRPACRHCHRTPLVGERIHVYEGRHRTDVVCDLCRPLRTALIPMSPPRTS